MIKCEQCKWFKPTPLGGGGKEAGECHFRPPSVFPLPTQAGLSFVTVWPTTQGDQAGCASGDPKLGKNDIN